MAVALARALHPAWACHNRMDLQQKIRTLPTQPGVYLYKNAEGALDL